MKQIIYLSLLLMTLTGCSINDEKSVAAKTSANNTIPSYYSDYVLNPQVSDDRLLQEVGQFSRDNRGELKVKAAEHDSRTFKIGSIELAIKEAKILHFKPDYSLIDFYHSYTHDQEFDFVKFFVEIKNTSNQPLKFAPIAIVNTSPGEKVTFEDDIYLEDLNGEIAPNGMKKGNLGFIIEESTVNSIEIMTSDVFSEKDEKINDGETIRVEF
ncbi:DUF4352 domain-containing protein [Cytobacillus praedii]|uniref:DUF4352 domain-containing protein n=1 Tax=Cytobacillus praedii TaxID=1742358 RepID=UPI000709875E|nr:hypothetical protein [Cytobacillus praedii]